MDTRHEVGNNTNMSSAQLIGTRHTSLIILALATTAALAQVDDSKAQIEQLEAQLESSWWITVEAERGQRIMRVTSIGSRGDGNFAVDLNYGILGGFLGPLKATLFRQSPPLTVNPQEWIGSKTFRIEFITGAGTQISAESAAPGTFVGTFTPRSGRTKQITFERVSEEEVQTRLAGTTEARRQAAQKWLAKDKIEIDYEGAWRWTVPVDMKTKTAMFYFPANDYCMGTVPADVRVDGQGMLVFVFDSMRAGCAQFQYTFDPVLRSGSIRQRPAGSPPETPWSRPSGAKISLIE
jgi:hypothetical protein